MADTPLKDPAAMFRDLVSQWEKGVNTLANQAMASDEYSGSVNQAMGMTLKMQQTMGEAMTGYLTSLNLPSRNDIMNISERLLAIEAQLERFNAVLSGLNGKSGGTTAAGAPMAAATPMPPRTKRAPERKADS